MITVSIPLGSHVITPAQQEQRRRYREEQERAAFKKQYGPRFGFVFSDTRFEDVQPSILARLIYLSTYLDYSGNLMLSQRKRMKRENLSSVLRVSVSSANRLWEATNGKYLFEDESGYVKMNTGFFLRGKLPYQGQQFQKLFLEEVRSLYEQSPPSKHKLLGYLFSLLPFISVEHNILCFNPLEKDINKLEPLSIDDFCKLIGYDTENRARLIKAYSKIVFLSSGVPERFVFFVTDGTNISNAKMIVNPRLLFRGSDPVSVLNLCKLCE